MTRPRSRLSRSICLALLTLSAALPLAAQAEAPDPSPSMQAYAELSVVREKYSDIIWGQKSATPEELRQIIAALERDIERSNEPLMRELSDGNAFLRYRRFNILVDLVKLHTRLDEPEKALTRLQDLAAISWSVPELFNQEPKFDRVKALPGYAAIQRQAAINQQWSEMAVMKLPYQEQLPVSARVAGLSRLWTVVRDGFVWFDHAPADLDWDQAYLDAIPEVIAAKDTAAFYEVLVRLVARLHDGHSNVYYPEALQDRYYAQPGLRTRRLGDTVVVSSIQDAGLLKQGVLAGDEVLRVDGNPVLQYGEQRVAPFESSSTVQDRNIRAYAYSLLAGDAKVPVALTLKNASGKVFEIKAPRSGFETAPADPPKPLFELRDDGIAILRVPQLEDDASLKALQANLTTLADAKGLILDLRGNGGGSSNHGTDILEYLTREPLPNPTVSFRNVYSYLEAARSDRLILDWRQASIDPDRDLPKEHYAGPVAMLIDARSFSAAEDTAAVFKMMKRGIIVGMPSGGSTGQPFLFPLPGGGMARICVKRDQYADGTDFVGVGVLPDVEASVTVDDFRNNADSVRDLAVSLLLDKAKAVTGE